MRKIFIDKIEDLEGIIKYGEVELKNLGERPNGALIELVIFDDNRITIIYDYTKVNYHESLIDSERMLFSIEHLITITGNYIPVYDKIGKLLFTEADYDYIKSKMQGLSRYGSNNYTFSNNLDFPEIEDYIKEIEDNIIVSNKKRDAIISLLKKELNKNSISLGIGSEKKSDVYLIDIGSCDRGTNIPSETEFEFIAKVSPRIINRSSKFFELERLITYTLGGSINDNLLHNSIRNVTCKLDEFSEPINVDLTFISSEEELDYTTESAIMDRLETMKKVNFDNYLKVIANIVFAKKYLKKHGLYNSSRNNEEIGLSGVGIENLIIQNGGSLYDAAKEFLEYARGNDFIEFEKIYPLFDFGKNYVSIINNTFPYDNFIMKNMKIEGYDKMCDALKEYVNFYENEMTKDGRKK